MSNDLEKFLQQAAERLREKMKQAQAPANQQSNRSQRSQPPALPRATRPFPPQVPQPPIVEAKVVGTLRESGPNPLSTLDTRPSIGHVLRPKLASEISQADEKMAGHLQQVFDHKITNLRSPSEALQDGSVTNKEINVQNNNRRKDSIGPLLEMMRNPSSMRALFIASEILRRKF